MRQVHENARISIMKTALDTDLNLTIPASLPPADLLRIIAEKDRVIAEHKALLEEREARLKEREALLAEQQKLLRLLEEQLRLARLRKFGSSSEKQPFQGELFDEAELEVSLEEVEQELAEAKAAAGAEPKKPRKRRKADGFDENLPRLQVHLSLDEAEKAGASRTFFSKVKEELDIVPAQARVIEYWQEKAVFDTEDGSQQVVAAARPVHPLGKCLASVPLLAWVLVAKYADALPLYRLEGILKRHGGRISRTTLANWIIRLDDVFQPLINLLREQQRSGDYLQADETRLQVLKERGKAPQSDKWMWLIRGGPPDRPVVLYEYDPSRSEEVPLRLLDGFKGTLQTDGYAGYNKVCREQGLTRIGCWDHARRKFVEASKAAPAKRKGAKVSKADVAIGKIRKLYAIEKRIRDLDPEEKTRQRQQRAQPVLDDLKAWLKRVFDLVKDFGTSEPPKSTRSSTTHWCPGRPSHPAFRHNIASSLRLHTGLPYDWTPRSDAPLGSPLAPSARRVSRVASRLPGTTRLRFALHGGQREKNVTRVPRNSLTYQAMQYTLNQWDRLTGYLADGRLHISNALAENAIRPFAVGRRNWLFADTPRGARASATVYSLIETAKANGLEPFTYLHHVLQHIGAASTVEDIEALLPWNVDLKGVQEG